ncbi:diaminopimelate decarboxylase [Blastopirellula marina]|uniref:Diaminopimelate decarboxylase n=1 Tax=Blastopirellula marina TaxID=124 RepID=A0A2S8GPR3_9BACT|nr:diaminopimelate decarboxylase [Blastopirellula marina]PQO46419.1 diaminopimelate decarboxylase [Blastopirellula marina]
MPQAPTFTTSRQEIAGVSVPSLAAEFGTPTYVYDAAKIVERINDLASFDVVRYAQKACSNLAILKLVREQGVMVDAVSAWEIRRALAAGFDKHGDPPPIVYTADIFDREALELCIEHGLHVNCGSPDMIRQLGEAAPGSEITLRINPGFGHGHSQKTNTGGQQSKHGIWHEQLGNCLLLADANNLSVTGLHMHIGSGTDLDHLSQVCDSMEKAALEVGRSIKTISAGGGLPIPYNSGQTYVDLDKYFELWDATRKRLEESFGHKISLEIEPGRYLAAEAGYLIAEIRAVKEMGTNLFYVGDAGFNNLARPIMYGAYHPISIARQDGQELEPSNEVIVGGPLCESGDIFTQEEGGFVSARKLPPATIGDLLVIECAGAYGYCMSSNYNSKPLAAEVLVEDGKARLIRRRQTFEGFIADEMI